MGKKNRPPPQSKPTGQAAPPAFLSKLFATPMQAAPLLNIPPPDWNEQEVRDLWTGAPQEVLQRLGAFIEQFASFGTQLKRGLQALDEQKMAIEAERQSLVREREELSTQRSAVSEEQLKHSELSSAFHDQQALLEAKQSELLRKEQTLLVQEAALRGGLVSEREEALKLLREQIDLLEGKRDRLAVEIQAQREQILDQARADAAALIDVARARTLTLQADEVEQAKRSTELDKREERLKMNEELLRVGRSVAVEAVQEELEQVQRAAKERETRLQQRLDRKSEELDRLQEELDELEDLRSSAGGDPRALLDELEKLRRECREKDRELQDAQMRLASDDPAELKAQRDLYLDKIRELDAELVALRSQEGNWRRSVTEREDWERAKAAMERSRAVLHEQNDRLRRDVESLLDKREGESAFPALMLMDREMAVDAHTDPVPKLPQLVSELRARIAHSGGEGKVLQYSTEDIQIFLGGLAMSHLHILQGISGTGKTSLAMAFAKAVGGHCTTVAVQAGWRDRNDLLGYYNAFEKKYYEKNTLQALYRAQMPQWKDRFNIVLLDEMNLSRPEQYFADFLSALEMNEPDRWINLMDSPAGGVAPELLRGGRDVLVPPNVWFIGTANQDETTNSFADKTHDRAFVMELHKVDGEDATLKRPESPAQWSVSSLKKSFSKAFEVWRPQVEDLLQFINASELTRLLSSQWHLGWGNRFEAQFKRFVPVVLESGGSESVAVDHMLHSRMFRDGKVVGRHDMSPDDLRTIEDALHLLWEECELEGEPARCLAALDRDRKRMERGG